MTGLEDPKPKKEHVSVFQSVPLARLDRQLSALNQVLEVLDENASKHGVRCEQLTTRSFIIGQIEALTWAAKLWETE